MRASLMLLICISIIGLALVGCGRGVDSWEKQIQSEKSADLRREGVLELMGQRSGRSDRAVKLFTKLAKTDPDPTVRSAAVQALGESDNATAVVPLTEILASEAKAQERIDAAVALGKVRGPEAVRPLLSQLRKDRLSEVQAACARTLGDYRYPGVVQVLVATMLNDNFNIVFEAQQSLEKLTDMSFQTSRDWQNWLDENGDPFAVARTDD